MVEEDRACVIRKEREAAEVEIMRNAAASELLSVERVYLSSKQGVGLLNRLTYCRVLSYLSTVIELEAVLSPKLRIQLLFHLTTDGSEGKLIVDGTHVDLKYADTCPVSTVPRAVTSDTYWDRETVLANIFFSDVMCSERVHGPLSEGFLSNVLSPADIPPVIRRVSHSHSHCLTCFFSTSTTLNAFLLYFYVIYPCSLNNMILHFVLYQKHYILIIFRIYIPSTSFFSRYLDSSVHSVAAAHG